jgi:hypothetical protein
MSLDAIRSEVLPNLLTAYLGPQGYRAEVFVHGDPSEVIYRSSPENARRIGPDADGSVRLFGIRYPKSPVPWRGNLVISAVILILLMTTVVLLARFSKRGRATSSEINPRWP